MCPIAYRKLYFRLCLAIAVVTGLVFALLLLQAYLILLAPLFILWFGRNLALGIIHSGILWMGETLYLGLMVSMLIVAFLFIRFLFVSRKNLDRLKVQGLHFGPWLTILLMLVPMVDIFTAPVAIGEIWKGSAAYPELEKDEWIRQPQLGWLKLWWFLTFIVPFLILFFSELFFPNRNFLESEPGILINLTLGFFSMATMLMMVHRIGQTHQAALELAQANGALPASSHQSNHQSKLGDAPSSPEGNHPQEFRPVPDGGSGGHIG